MNEKFQQDLERFYELVSQNHRDLGELYNLIEDRNYDIDLLIYLDDFLDECELEHSSENYLALLSRLINLRDEQFVQTLIKNNTPKEIEAKRALAYLWTKKFYIKRHEELLRKIDDEELLNSFYRELLSGVHAVGLVLSDWQYDWNEHIINYINPGLKEKYGENVIKFLEENSLFDRDENGNLTDRSYSVLTEDSGKYRVLSYAQFFKKYTDKIGREIQKLVEKLEPLEDNDTNQKDSYIAYLNSLKDAFCEEKREKLLARWQELDRRWMDVTSPLQIGHPLEYYEDHYRKAVALEWDVRLSNPKNLGANGTLEAISYMYETLFDKFGQDFMRVKDGTMDNLKRVQLYIGRPALYYASEFNGLFSAQVVPNDEQVTKERGKKVFAFAENILDSQRAKPALKIDRVVLGADFIDKQRELIFKKEEIWHKVYEVSTIGHEFGHILWLDEDSESLMNASGVFKNIEEFKATSGGLTAFFMSEDKQIKEYVFLDIIKRSIGLIAWRKTAEVEPYYCEGLIHLKALFDSGVMEFDGKLTLHVEDKTYEVLKNWYLKTYEELALHYLHKRDASEFLERFTYKKDGDYMPIDKKVEDFVEYYWKLHQDIGRELDKHLSA